MTIEVERLKAEIEADPSRAIADLGLFDSALTAVTRDREADIDVDTGNSIPELAALQALIAEATRDRTVNIDVDRSSITGATRDTNAFSNAIRSAAAGTSALASAAGGGGGVFSSIASGASGAAGAAASLAGGFTGLLQAFIPLMVMGAFFGSILPGALASAAAGAGVLYAALAPLVGLVGMLVPLIGGLALVGGTLFAGLSGVVSGLQAYGDAAGGAAVDSKALAAAQRELAAAQKGMAQAAYEAREALQDQHFATRQAILSERAAVLALEEAQKNLAKAQEGTVKAGHTLTQQTDEFTGKTYDVAYASVEATGKQEDLRRARLAVAQAELDLARARDHTKDMQRLLAIMEKKGIKGSDQMVAARERLRRAEEALAAAQKQTTASTEAWNEAQKKLSPTGIEFVKFLHDEFMPALSGISKAVQESMLPGIERGLRALMSTFDEVKGELSIVGELVGDAFADFFEFWAKPKQQKQLTEMFRVLNDVIESGLGLIRPFSRLIVGITTTAGPALASMLETLGGWFDDLADKIDSNQSDVKDFFDDASYFGGLWLDVLRPIGGIFRAIARAAKPLAEKWLKGMADSLEETSEWLNSRRGQKDIFTFISDQIPTLKTLWEILGDIKDILFTSEGGEDSAFYKFLVAIRDDFLPEIKELMEDLETSGLAGSLVTGLSGLVSFLNAVDWKQVERTFEKMQAWSQAQGEKDFGDYIRGGLQGLGKWFATEVKGLLTFPDQEFDRLFDSIGKNFEEDVAAPIRGFLGADRYKGGDGFRLLCKDLKGWWETEFWPGMRQIVHDKFIQPFKNLFEDAMDWLKARWNAFKEWWDDHTNLGIDLSGVKDAFWDLIDFIKDVWNGFLGWWDDHIPDLPDFPDLPGFPGNGKGKGGGFDPPGDWGWVPGIGERRAVGGERSTQNVEINNTFNEKVDPQHVAREIAWSLAS